MVKKRLIACLLMRDGLIVQSIGFGRYLPIGRPKFPIEFVARWDVDEIVLLDMSATSQGRGPDLSVLEALSRSSFVPLTVGGGIRSADDVRRIIAAGADKVAVNAHAVERPAVITEIADQFGSQCVVVSMDCRREADGTYQVYTRSGSMRTEMTASDWAARVEALGAGEILVNSIDRDGSKLGYDLELIRGVAAAVKLPVIALGGVGHFADFTPGIVEAGASAVAAANIFHFVEHSTILAKAQLLRAGVDVRLDSEASYRDREFSELGRLLMLPRERLMEIEFRRGTRDVL